MARGRSQRSRGNLPSARTAWLDQPAGALGGALTSGAPNFEVTLYDFGGSSKMADNYGAGDWTVYRMIGSLGAQVVTAAVGLPGLVKVVLGIGMLNARTGVQDGAVAQIVSPIAFPELAWMVTAAVYINLNSSVASRPMRMDFDVKSRRIISQQAIMAYAVYTDPVIADGTVVVDFNIDLRTLVRQKGSRL